MRREQGISRDGRGYVRRKQSHAGSQIGAGDGTLVRSLRPACSSLARREVDSCAGFRSAGRHSDFPMRPMDTNPRPEHKEPTPSAVDDPSELRPAQERGGIVTSYSRHWPGWRYALFLTSLFVTLIVAAAAGTLTLSSLVRSGSAGTADQPLIPASLGGNTSGGAPLETWEVTVTPNWVSPHDSASSNYQGVWVSSNSPATPHRSNDSCHSQGRYLLLDPRVSDADGRAGRDQWWFVIERKWPSGFDPQAHGDWGRLVNFHNVAGDVGWDSGSGVSAWRWIGCRVPRRRSSRSVSRRRQAALFADSFA